MAYKVTFILPSKFLENELLDPTLFLDITSFMPNIWRDSIGIANDLYEKDDNNYSEDSDDERDEKENVNNIIRDSKTIKEKISRLTQEDQLFFWNFLTNLDPCIMDKESMCLMKIKGIFFHSNYKFPIIQGYEDVTENEARKNTFKWNRKKNKEWNYIYKYIEKTFDDDDDYRADQFAEEYPSLKQDEEDLYELNRRLLRRLSDTDLNFLKLLKSYIETEKLYMNIRDYLFNTFKVSGFIFNRHGKLVLFCER